MNRKDIGNAGETAAAVFLEQTGYTVVERNFTVCGGEIDIIAAKDGCIVFIEVKTRKNSSFGYPSEFVNLKKQRRIENAALIYCGGDCNMRFDVIEVYYEEMHGEIFIKQINHIENAF